ncbi:MAG: nuclear transport factor 2 family protein [Actinomycetota bacterium]|nr:nuclear transport factor 2 family protein [Actinomycetota bacterium]
MTGDEVRAVEAANEAFYRAIESADLDLLEAVVLDGSPADAAAVTTVHPGWPLLRGRGEVLRSFAAVMAGTPYIQFILTDVDVRTLGDVAVVTCAENILTGVERESDGETELGFAAGRVVATNVFRRTPSGWRLWVHHASPVMVGEDGDDGEDDGSP